MLVADGNRMLRFIYEAGIIDFQKFQKSKSAQNFVEAGLIVSTQVLDQVALAKQHTDMMVRNLSNDSRVVAVLGHERLPFPSYPYEWSPAMLFAAAELTLDLVERLLDDGIGLKDATPYNIIFRGPKPVFVDILSFEARATDDPIWLPHAQFMRTFYLPLLVNSKFGISLAQLFLTKRDGIEPEEVYMLCSSIQKFLSPFLFQVSIPVWLSSSQRCKSGDIYLKSRVDDSEKAKFILKSLLARLRNSLNDIAPKRAKSSVWSSYMDSHSYSDDQFRAKNEFVEELLKINRPASVLDVGCNTGFFSAIAARNGARVTAIDYDPAVIDNVWRMAEREELDILPLVVNLGRPSPAVGWLNQECASFIARAIGAFDAVIMLAVVHHMLVTDQIPLDEIIDLAAQMTNDLLIVEFVSPQDSMFKKIARGRGHLYEGVNQEAFEISCQRHFYIIQSLQIDGTQRKLYAMKKKDVPRL